MTHPSTVVVLAFMAAVTVGTLVLMLPWATAEGRSTTWLTALFTATSAVCVTGLALVDTGTHWSGFGQVAILVMFQLGGFGMMTMATLLGLMVGDRMGLRSRVLLQAETRSLALGDVRSLLKLVAIITVTVEGVAALALALRFVTRYQMPWGEALWQGLFHAVSAFNNAGFSTWGDSVMRFVSDAWVLSPLMAAIVIGGLGFPVLHERLVRRRTRARPSLHSILTFWGTTVLILGGTLAFWWAEASNAKTLGTLGFWDQGLAALFTSISARTAGFNVLDTGALSSESLALHYVLMFIGAGSAGTAGGVKVTTFFVLLLMVWNEVRGHQDVEFRGRRIATSVQRQAIAILVLSAAAVVLALLALLPMTTLPFEKVLFEVISAFATVGLSTGITAQFPPEGQLILVALMFTGRVGVVTLAAALALNQGRRAYRYPEEKPLVG